MCLAGGDEPTPASASIRSAERTWKIADPAMGAGEATLAQPALTPGDVPSVTKRTAPWELKSAVCAVLIPGGLYVTESLRVKNVGTVLVGEKLGEPSRRQQYGKPP